MAQDEVRKIFLDYCSACRRAGWDDQLWIDLAPDERLCVHPLDTNRYCAHHWGAVYISEPYLREREAWVASHSSLPPIQKEDNPYGPTAG